MSYQTNSVVNLNHLMDAAGRAADYTAEVATAAAQAIAQRELSSNKVASITAQSTNDEYPGAAAVKSYVDTVAQGKQDTLNFDAAPTANSANPVTSGGIKTALDGQ